MVEDNDFNLSFIPTALERSRSLLHEARIAYRMRDDDTGDAKLFEAGAEGLEALSTLYFHPLWDKLREEQQLRVQQWENLKLPIVKELFVLLGYEPPPDVRELTDLGNEQLKRAAGISDDHSIDHIAQAQQRIADLYHTLEQLLSALYRAIQSSNITRDVKNKLRDQIIDGLVVACKTLGKGLAIGVMLPAAELAMHKLGPHAVDLVHQLQDSTHVLPAVPIVLAVSIPVDVTSWFNDLVNATTRRRSTQGQRQPQRPGWTKSLSEMQPEPKRIVGPTGASEAPKSPVHPLPGQPRGSGGIVSAPTGQPQAPTGPSRRPPRASPDTPLGTTDF